MNKKTSMLLLISALLMGAVAGCKDDSSTTGSNGIGPTNYSAENQTPSDVDVSSRVKAAILSAPGIQSRDLQVDSHDQQVVISGVVSSEAQKELAQHTADHVAGSAWSVDNELVVRSHS